VTRLQTESWFVITRKALHSQWLLLLSHIDRQMPRPTSGIK